MLFQFKGLKSWHAMTAISDYYRGDESYSTFGNYRKFPLHSPRNALNLFYALKRNAYRPFEEMTGTGFTMEERKQRGDWRGVLILFQPQQRLSLLSMVSFCLVVSTEPHSRDDDRIGAVLLHARVEDVAQDGDGEGAVEDHPPDEKHVVIGCRAGHEKGNLVQHKQVPEKKQLSIGWNKKRIALSVGTYCQISKMMM